VELHDAVVVVTGASSGFGEIAARMFAAEGATVVLAARRLERLETIGEWIGARGGTALPVECDVSRLADLQELRERVDEAYGRCDVLVNNAGVRGGGLFADDTLENIERVVRVNLLGVMFGTKVFLPMMLERGRGHIVNIASLAGRFATPGASVYSATKHAVVAFSESLYQEVRGRGVLVTSVNPGFSPTEGFPQTRMPSIIQLKPERVARAIVDVVKQDKAPEVSVPRAMAPLQAFRVLTPPLYRWGVRTASRRVIAPKPPKQER
jgi:NADP-dependent 3-hydroxy acid dehydrogenase YdfG